MKPTRRLANTLLMTGVFFPASAWAAPDLLAYGSRILAQESGRPVRSYMTFDFGAEKNTNARSVLVPEKGWEALLLRIRSKMGPGLIAFVGTINDENPKKLQVELVVAKGVDQFEILRLAQTDGVNYGLKTEAIIAELKAWDREFGIDIRHAQTDQIHVVFKTLPKDQLAFANRAVKFCPDLRQTIPTVPAIAAALYRTKDMMLWWD
jgi:hypothetical protein